MLSFTVEQIAGLLKGEVRGDGSRKIHNVGKIQDATEYEITFLSNPKYESFIYESQAGAVVVNKDFEPKQTLTTTIIVVEDAYVAFSQLLETYSQYIKYSKTGIEQPSFIDATAVLGENVYVGAFAYVGNKVKIGNNVKIYPHVYIGDNTTIGDNTVLYSGVKVYGNNIIGNHCTIHSGVVVGSDGFGFAPQTDGTYKTIPQVGNVIIGNNVDIGANTAIDCATMGSTIIEDGVKLDNFIQIAHNVKIGKNTVIASHTGISGSTEIGENCVIAGQVGMVGHIKVAKGTKVGAQSGITKAVTKEYTTLLGSPALEHRESLRVYAVYTNLPELKKRVDDLEKQFKNLEQTK